MSFCLVMTRRVKTCNEFKLCECGTCSDLIPIRDKRGIVRKYKFGHQNRGKLNGQYKGGRKKVERGYIWVLNRNHPNSLKGGYIQEHRLIMSQYLGRPLTKDEDVHHINGIKDDNRIENLQLISHGNHSTHHNKGNKYSKVDMSGRICLLCGT